jgi:hypothetical protein
MSACFALCSKARCSYKRVVQALATSAWVTRACAAFWFASWLSFTAAMLALEPSSGSEAAAQSSQGTPICQCPGQQSTPQLATDAMNRLLFIWRDDDGTSTKRLRASLRSAAAALAPGWDLLGNALGAPDAQCQLLSLVRTPRRGTICVWNDQALSQRVRIHCSQVQTMSEQVPPVGVNDAVAITTGADFEAFSAACSLDTASICVLVTTVTNFAYRAQAVRVTFNDSLQAGIATLWTPPDSIGESQPYACAPDSSSGVYIACVSTMPMSPSLRLFHVDRAGAAVSGWPTSGLLLAAGPMSLSNVRLVSDAMGGCYVAWLSSGTLRYTYVPNGMVVPNGSVAVDRIMFANQPTGVSAFEIVARGQTLFADALVDSDQGVRVLARACLSDGTSKPGWPDDGIFVDSSPRDASALALPVMSGDSLVFCPWVATKSSPEQGSDLYVSTIRIPVASNGYVDYLRQTVCDAPGDRFEVTTAYDNLDDQALLAWSDTRSGVDADIYFARLDRSGVVGARCDLSLQYATLVHGEALVRWQDRGGGCMGVLKLERAVDDGVSTEVGSVWPDYDGNYCVKDSLPLSVVTATYTLSSRATGMHWIATVRAMREQAPSWPGLNWKERPHIVGSRVVAAIESGSESSVRVDVFDVLGRRMASERLRSSSSSHVLPLSIEAAAFRAGLYFVRAVDRNRQRLVAPLVILGTP